MIIPVSFTCQCLTDCLFCDTGNASLCLSLCIQKKIGVYHPTFEDKNIYHLCYMHQSVQNLLFLYFALSCIERGTCPPTFRIEGSTYALSLSYFWLWRNGFLTISHQNLKKYVSKNLILLTMMQSIGWNGQNSLYEIWNAIMQHGPPSFYQYIDAHSCLTRYVMCNPMLSFVARSDNVPNL